MASARTTRWRGSEGQNLASLAESGVDGLGPALLALAAEPEAPAIEALRERVADRSQTLEPLWEALQHLAAGHPLSQDHPGGCLLRLLQACGQRAPALDSRRQLEAMCPDLANKRAGAEALLAAAEALLEVAPADPLLLLVAGSIHRHLGHTAEATAAFEAACAEAPGMDDAWLARASLIAEADPKAAARLLLEPARAHPERLRLHLAIVECLERAGELSSAVDLLTRVARRAGSPNLVLDLAELMLAAGRPDGARAALEVAKAMRHSSARLAFLHGAIAEKNSAKEEAIAHYRRALEGGWAQAEGALAALTRAS